MRRLIERLAPRKYLVQVVSLELCRDVVIRFKASRVNIKNEIKQRVETMMETKWFK